MPISSPEYKYIIFYDFHRKPNGVNKVVIDNDELTQVNSAKYLGVIIDHKLNWIEHMSYVYKEQDL